MFDWLAPQAASVRQNANVAAWRSTATFIAQRDTRERSLAMDRKTPLPLPRALVVVIRPFQVFLNTSSASGIVLLFATIVAMVWANSRFAAVHQTIFGSPLAVQVGRV